VLVRDDEATTQSEPLFKGNCIWRISLHEGQRRLEGTLWLWLNPTRYMRLRSGAASLPEAILARVDPPEPPHGEMSFVRKATNWLPLWGRLFHNISQVGWSTYLSRYLNHTENALSSEFARVCELQQCPSTFTPIYNLKSVETYWEWMAENPLTVVNVLENYLRTFTPRRFRRRNFLDSEYWDNMLVIQATVRDGVTLKIYAKTNLRIRIEVTHKLYGKRPFRMPPLVIDGETINTGSSHVFTSKPDMLEFISRLRDSAADVVNEFLRHASRSDFIPASNISGALAIARVIGAVGDQQLAETILDCLVNRGVVVTREWSEAGREAIRALCRQGILQTAVSRGASSASRDLYRPTPPYTPAFRLLREYGGLLLMNVRRRERPSLPTE